MTRATPNRFAAIARAIARRLAADGEAILLGSIATGKYRNVLLDVFGERLKFPRDFVGRGDMSRGGLLLRAARNDVELPYVSVAGAVVKGRRAPRIAEMEGLSGLSDAIAAFFNYGRRKETNLRRRSGSRRREW